MPTSTKQDYLEVLQALVAFAEGETLSIPIPLLTVGDGLLTPHGTTMRALVTGTAAERTYLQHEFRHYVRGIANGYAEMITPFQIRIHTTTRVVDHPTRARRPRATRTASYAIEGSARDWLFYLTDRVLAHVAIEALRTCPSCERAFVKVTRKKFCSATCQKRTFMREWRSAKAKE